MKRFIAGLIALMLIIPIMLKADEGMWLPLLIKRLNETDMQKEGLKLTAEEIYSVNNSSLKDAIVHFGGFCTGEIISPDGLILTNHHCGYEAITDLSSVQDNILTNGFFALNHNQEKPAAGLSVTFLVRMEDVTSRVLALLGDTMSEESRTKAIADITKKIKDENSESGRYRVDVKSFFKGNEFYLFVYETYKDVRLVGSPPESVGKFGGDTDNWMWPRHTGDFSLFRVYMSADGKPTDYSKDNIPYKSKHYLPINIGAKNKDDFAMIMGYPGATDRYLTSFGVDLAVEQTNPAIVKLRTRRLELIKHDMDADVATRLKLATEYAKISNYWKYFIGQTKGLKRLHTADDKRAIETKFETWAASSSELKMKYGNVIPALKSSYADMHKYNVARWYFSEGVFGNQTLTYAYTFNALAEALANKESKPEDIVKLTTALKAAMAAHFANYNAPTDQKVFAALLKMYSNDVPKEQQAPVFEMVRTKYKGDFNAFAKKVFENSMFVSEEKTKAFLDNPTSKKLQKDMAYSTVKEIFDHYVINVRGGIRSAQAVIDKNMRLFVDGLRKMEPERKFYPDANSTMRLSYGKIEDYDPVDGVHYNFYTTIEGIMEKMDNTNAEFTVPDKLVQLYKNKDYGRYGANGSLPVCFITNNDITGGNSGSPVINGNGELIGLAFDGNWEAMSGDIDYDEIKRTICVDSRYVLWCIEKLGGAPNIVNEMKLVN
ncbi:MAG: S46 family peptidase [Bacteroidota bacterium]